MSVRSVESNTNWSRTRVSEALEVGRTCFAEAYNCVNIESSGALFLPVNNTWPCCFNSPPEGYQSL